jgi:hypothetical protein
MNTKKNTAEASKSNTRARRGFVLTNRTESMKSPMSWTAGIQ